MQRLICITIAVLLIGTSLLGLLVAPAQAADATKYWLASSSVYGTTWYLNDAANAYGTNDGVKNSAGYSNPTYWCSGAHNYYFAQNVIVGGSTSIYTYGTSNSLTMNIILTDDSVQFVQTITLGNQSISGIRAHAGDHIKGIQLTCYTVVQYANVDAMAIDWVDLEPTQTPTVTQTRTVTQTPTITQTPTRTPTVTPTPGVVNAFTNVLRDGDMEQRPTSNAWGLPNPNSTFGRLTSGDWFNGSNACQSGTGYQAIGKLRGWPWQSGEWGAIYQNFSWLGEWGTLYWSMTARGSPDNSAVAARVRMYLKDDAGTIYMLSQTQVDAGWYAYTGELAGLATGNYQIFVENGGSVYDTVYVDDIAVTSGGRAMTCSNSSGYGGADGTATPTPMDTVYVPMTNCDFESGLTGWSSGTETYLFYAAENSVLDAYPPGPVGPNYLVPDSKTLNKSTWGPTIWKAAPIWRDFTWSNDLGPIFLTFWGRGHVKVVIRPTGYAGVPLIDEMIYGWTKIQVVYSGQRSFDGHYQLMLYNPNDLANWVTQRETAYDGFSLSANNFSDTCSQNPTPTPISTVAQTATPSQTWTPSRTPTGTIKPSRTPTRTPYPSLTPSPLPSWTPKPTRTNVPTSTMLNTATQPAAEKTATAQGTPIPTYTMYPTYTAFPTGTPAPWGTPTAPSDPGPAAFCDMPDDWFNVSAWVDFEVCRALRFFSWSPANDAQVAGMSSALQGVEPYGTLLEGYESLNALRDTWNAYDWINTGYEGKYQYTRPSLESITLPALDGDFSFTPSAEFDAQVAEEVAFCKDRTTTVFGQRVAEGMCIAWTYYYITGLVAWIQFFWDLAVLLLLIRYLYRSLFSRGQ